MFSIVCSFFAFTVNERIWNPFKNRPWKWKQPWRNRRLYNIAEHRSYWTQTKKKYRSIIVGFNHINSWSKWIRIWWPKHAVNGSLINLMVTIIAIELNPASATATTKSWWTKKKIKMKLNNNAHFIRIFIYEYSHFWWKAEHF